MFDALLEAPGLGLVRACADDLAAVVYSATSLTILHSCFDVIQFASGLTLSPSKCVLIPLDVPLSAALSAELAALILSLVPSWASFAVAA
eukprot:8127385-Karenia_brevis.AAC.1